MTDATQGGDSAGAALAAPSNLRCEYLQDPLGIDVRRPRFSWQLVSAQRGEGQTAYQVLVASSAELLAAGKADKWDSGRVESDETVHIEYQGALLASRERLWWAVRCWDRRGRVTPFSEPATFEMGLLEDDDWQARWIGADEGVSSPLLRKTFRVRGPIARARIYICGLGYYELHLNGHKVGDHVLDPNWTDYDQREMRDLLYPFDDQTAKRVLYVTYDVTSLLEAGDNAVGVMLGNGWYNQRERTAEGKLWYDTPRLLLRLEITYQEGTRESVVSDASWKCARGPITFNNIFFGEVYDARLEQPGWDRPGFDDGAWESVQIVRAPTGKLYAQLSPPDKVMSTLAPVALTQPQPGIHVYDFGQNFSGWVRLRARGEAGTQVRLRFAEEITPDGMLDFSSAGGDEQIQSDVYLLKGMGDEEYEPRFTWHGFRYVEMTGYPGTPSLETLEGRVVHSAVESAGKFTCSNPLLSKIQENYRWTQLSNYHGSVPSDCPHRERLGYTGDGHVTAEAAMLSFWVPRLYTKWLGDISDAQNHVSGFVPHTAPFYGGGGGPGWGAGYVIVAWRMYEHYADRRILETHYPELQHWMEYLAQCTDDDGIVVREEPGSWCLGDWAFPVHTGDAVGAHGHPPLPPPLVNTYFYGVCARLMANIARVLGKEDDAQRYAALADSLAQALHRRFFDDERGCYSIGRHGADAFAFALGAVPETQRARVLQHVLENIAQHDDHFDTGIFGTPLLLEVLTDNGHAQTAYELLAQTTYPSYGYLISLGATTLWEDWEHDRGSHCHPMFGSVSAWFYRTLAGIRVDPEGPGFKAIIIEPHVVGDLTWVRAVLETVRGKVAVEWRREKDHLQLNLTIPTGSSAYVHFPATGYANPVIREGQQLLWSENKHHPGVTGITRVWQEGQIVVARIEGGEYRFEIRAGGRPPG